ncbi:MAG: hypothetical protein KKF24_16060 [Gammaproteobacteria bacterium]|nr:hypothetical protein [Gammaproteobacteria bacterium]MBU1834201.1 hypothetical protein [Gammaproteobacteria bacterium]
MNNEYWYVRINGRSELQYARVLKTTDKTIHLRIHMRYLVMENNAVILVERAPDPSGFHWADTLKAVVMFAAPSILGAALLIFFLG